MVADEDDARAFFARNVVQCVSLAVGGRKPELRRRRIKNDLGSCCRHIAPPCAQISANDGLPGHSSKSLLASRVVDCSVPMSELGGGLNRSAQHFILEGKDGVW